VGNIGKIFQIFSRNLFHSIFFSVFFWKYLQKHLKNTFTHSFCIIDEIYTEKKKDRFKKIDFQVITSVDKISRKEVSVPLIKHYWNKTIWLGKKIIGSELEYHQNND